MESFLAFSNLNHSIEGRRYARLVDPERSPHVHEAVIRLEPRTDQRAVGAAVTIELCGAVDHEEPCLWPNNHDVVGTCDDAVVFRTLFIAPAADVEEIHRRISSALHSSSSWSIVSERRRPLTSAEAASAVKLAATPRRT